MGRKIKYKTIEEKRESNNIARKKYYEKNKELICKKRMQKYYEVKVIVKNEKYSNEYSIRDESNYLGFDGGGEG